MNATGLNGLYALKPWYAHRLTGVRDQLVRWHVSPHALTALGIGFGAGAGLVLGRESAGPIAAVAVAALLAARLACANLDGGVARAAGRTSRFGSVANEIGDRFAEFAALAGTLVLAPSGIVAGAALAATLPSWIALAGAAAGARRVQGGPIGKTERCAVLVVIAATGWVVPGLAVLAAGSLITAALRLAVIRRELVSS